MNDFNDAAASRARLAAYDAERNRDRRRSRARRDERDRRGGTSSRSPEARLRVEAIRARRPGDPRGTLDAPLPMPDVAELTGRKPVNVREVIGD